MSQHQELSQAHAAAPTSTSDPHPASARPVRSRWKHSARFWPCRRNESLQLPPGATAAFCLCFSRACSNNVGREASTKRVRRPRDAARGRLQGREPREERGLPTGKPSLHRRAALPAPQTPPPPLPVQPHAPQCPPVPPVPAVPAPRPLSARRAAPSPVLRPSGTRPPSRPAHPGAPQAASQSPSGV